MKELLRLLSDAQSISATLTPTLATFVIGSTTIKSKLIDGTFPDYQRVIPDNNKGSMVIKSAELVSAIERVMCVASSETRRIKLDVDGKETLTISANSDDGDAVETLSIDYNGAPVVAAFNGKYLLDALEKIVKARITFGEEMAPAILQEDETQTPKFVVMPMAV